MIKTKSFFITTGLFILLTVILLAITASIGFKAKVETIVGDPKSAAARNQQIVITLNDQIARDTLSDAIEITPEAKYSKVATGNKIIITFLDDLNYNQNYQIKINKNLKDIFGNNLKKELVYKFTTKKLLLAYIQRSHGQNDKIVQSNPDFSDGKVLLEESYIEQFNINDEYLVAVIRKEDKTNKFVFLNLKNNESEEVDFTSKRIASIALSPAENKLAFTAQTVTPGGTFLIPEGGNNLYLYDIEKKDTVSINPDNSILDAVDLAVSPDGSALIFRAQVNERGLYFLVNLKNIDEYMVLDVHQAFGGFDESGKKLLFNDFDPLAQTLTFPFINLKDLDTNETKKITSGEQMEIDAKFVNEENVVYAKKYKDLASTKGIFQIENVNLVTNEETILLSDETKSLELPIVSANGRYIAIERYSQADLSNFNDFRNFVFQIKPTHAELIILDLQENKLIDSGVEGVNAVWVN